MSTDYKSTLRFLYIIFAFSCFLEGLSKNYGKEKAKKHP